MSVYSVCVQCLCTVSVYSVCVQCLRNQFNNFTLFLEQEESQGAEIHKPEVQAKIMNLKDEFLP